MCSLPELVASALAVVWDFDGDGRPLHGVHGRSPLYRQQGSAEDVLPVVVRPLSSSDLDGILALVHAVCYEDRDWLAASVAASFDTRAKWFARKKPSLGWVAEDGTGCWGSDASGMDFDEMRQMARTSREAYRELEVVRCGREWSLQDLFVGMVGDIGDLAQLLGALEGVRPGPDDLRASIGHELSDVLWSVLVIANELNIDLAAAFAELHDTLLSRVAVKLRETSAGGDPGAGS